MNNPEDFRWFLLTLIIVFALAMCVAFAVFSFATINDAIGAEPTATPPFTQTMTFLPYAAKPYATATPPIPEGYWHGEE